MQTIKTLTNFDGHTIRLILEDINKPLFCLIDVCNALDIKRPNPSRFKLNPKGTHKMCIPTNGGKQLLSFISEENLYRIVFKSTKPAALNFQTWVFTEVLPSIRKNGDYSTRLSAYKQLNNLHMEAKIQKEKGTFHGRGLNQHKGAIKTINHRIEACEIQIQLTFRGELSNE